MVQPQGDEHAVDEAVEEGSEHAGATDELADRGQPGVEQRVEPTHAEADRQARQRDHDGDESAAAEEAEVRRQLDVVVAVEEPGGDQAEDDAAEDAVVDRRLLARHVGDPVEHDRGHRGEDRLHHEVASHRCQGGRPVGLASETDGHADREEQGEVGEDGAARGAHRLEERADDGGVDLAQQVGLAEPEQDAGRGKQSDRQHEALAESLQLREPRDAQPGASGSLRVSGRRGGHGVLLAVGGDRRRWCERS